MVELSELIERVEKAVGPDRDLDALIWVATGPATNASGWCGFALDEGWRYEYEASGHFPGEVMEFAVNSAGQRLPQALREAPVFTFSVDAALALVEKMRPGYRWGVSSVAIKIGAYPDGKTAYGEGFRAHVTKNSPLRPMPSTADAPTPALAIIRALLRSLDTDNKGAVHGAP